MTPTTAITVICSVQHLPPEEFRNTVAEVIASLNIVVDDDEPVTPVHYANKTERNQDVIRRLSLGTSLQRTAKQCGLAKMTVVRIKAAWKAGEITLKDEPKE